MLADGWTGCCSQYGILRAGGACHWCQRLRAGASRAAPVAGVLSGVERHHHVASLAGQRTTALLVGWCCGNSARCIALFLHHWYGGHLLPDVGLGWFDAEMLGQHEDSVDAEHLYVCDGRHLQLPVYICVRAGRDRCCHRYWTGRTRDGLSDDVFPAVALGYVGDIQG